MTGGRILVIGSGGREHALAWALARSRQVEQVYVAPGNAGTEWSEHAGPDGVRLAPSTNVPIPVGDIPALIRSAQENAITLTVVGPELRELGPGGRNEARTPNRKRCPRLRRKARRLARPGRTSRGRWASIG